MDQTGCLGCASGKDAGARNIFGNKYGQNLAAIQIAREKYMELTEAKRQQQNYSIGDQQQRDTIYQAATAAIDEGECETDEDTEDEDDYGPNPAAGVWAGSKKLEMESETLAEEDYSIDAGKDANQEAETGDDEDERIIKRPRAD